MPGQQGSAYCAYASHACGHFLAGGLASLLAMLFPLLALGVVFLLFAAVHSGQRWAEVARRRRATRAASSRALTAAAAAEQPRLASDLERDQAARLVSHAVGEGRLSFEEGGERIDAVLRSRHRHELAELVEDLPSHDGGTGARLLTPTPFRRVLLAGAAVVILAAVLVQALVGLWELWPVAVVALGASSVAATRSRGPETGKI